MTKFEIMLEQAEQIVKDVQEALEVRRRLRESDFTGVNVAIQIRHTGLQLDAPVAELSPEAAAQLAETGIAWANKRILARLDELAGCVAALFDLFGDGRLTAKAPAEEQAMWVKGSPPDGPTE